MATIQQPTATPTNKLQAATLAAVLLSASGLIVRNIWPTWYDAELWAAMTPVAVFAVGYLVKDRPNVIVAGEPEAPPVPPAKDEVGNFWGPQ